MRQIKPRLAMTLVELLAASALAAVLMSTTLGVIGTLTLQRRTLLGNGEAEPWRRLLLDQLRWDLSNARKMCVQPSELRLVGYGGTDFDTAVATHRPSEIVYSVKEEGGRSWLLRQEIHLDANTLHNSRTELVAADITALDAYDPDKGNRQNRDRKTDTQVNRSGPVAYVPVPRRVWVVLYGEDEDKPILDEPITLR